MDAQAERYAQEKLEAESLDRRYGFRIDATEDEVRRQKDLLERARGKPQTWAHLSPQIFQTPYAELKRMVEDADPSRRAEAWVDLGSAYGRLGIVLSNLRPQARFFGIEIALPRVQEARRVYAGLGIPSAGLVHADLSVFPIPTADIYFIYDFGNRDEIQSVLDRLRDHASQGPIRVAGRGRAVRDAIERNHPWLGEVFPPLHRAHYSVYATGRAVD